MRILASVVLILAPSALAQLPPSITNVSNAGSNDSRFCPGLLVTITGNNFGSNSGVVSVVAAGQTAGVIDVNNNVIHAQLPLSASSAPTTLSVNVNGQPSNPFNITIDNYAPAFYGDSPVTASAAAGRPAVATLVGLGATDPFIPVGTVPGSPNPTVAKPAVTVGGINADVISSVASTTAAAVYLVTFTMPSVFPVGSVQDVVVSIGGKSTTQKASITVGLGLPSISTVVNAGAASAGLSPGVLATITGQDLFPASVTIGARNAPIIQSSANSAVVQVPIELTAGPATLTLTTTQGKSTQPFNISLNAVSPAFYGDFQTPAGATINSTNPAAAGSTVIAHLVGLGPTNPLLPTGLTSATQAPTVAIPTLLVGGKPAAYSYCGIEPGTLGLYRLSFTIPDGIAAATADVSFSIANVSAPIVSLPVSSKFPTLIGLRNAASGQLVNSSAGIAPNTFLSIYANNIGSADSTGNLFPATDFQGTHVLFGSTQVPLYNVIPSANLINIVTPSESPSYGASSMQIVSVQGAGQTIAVPMAPASVGIFRIPDPAAPARSIAAATVANTAWQILPASVAAEYKFTPCPVASALISCAGPAHPGDSIVIYFTGGGRATPNGDPALNPLPTGSVAPADGSTVYKTTLTPTLTIGGLAAPVLFSGIAPGTAAEYQINTVIPAGVAPGDDVPVVLSFQFPPADMGGAGPVTSSDTVTIAIKAAQ